MTSPSDSQLTRVLKADEDRLADVKIKHARVAELIERLEIDAILLQKPANISWFTAGGDVGRASCEMAAAVFITKDARVIVTNNVDAPQLFERELFGLGFQLKQRAWHESHPTLIADLCRGRKVVSDSGHRGTKNGENPIRQLRLQLTELECDRMRRLSKVAVYAVEATARRMYRGQTEAELAGEVAHRLMKRTVTPELVRVCADGRSDRYRHWTYSSDPIEQYAHVSCIARRWGLSVAVTRTVSLEPVPRELEVAHRKAMLMHATGMFFSRNGQSLSDVWPKVHRIYEKFGLAHEWQVADQADVIGYDPHEVRLTPDSDFQLQAPMAMHWHPSVGPAMLGDTILVQENEVEFVTLSRVWPRLTVEVKGHSVQCPDIYVVPDSTADGDDVQVEVDITEAGDSQLMLFGSSDTDLHMDSVWEMEIDRSLLDDEPSEDTVSSLDTSPR
ncbi:MAG: M24 family metallopeptidase [Planctomycetaceae bacterium]